MSNLLDQLSSHFSDDQVQAISSKLGIQPAQAKQAIAAALPTILGAVGRKASTEEGAAEIHAAVQQDHGGSALGNLGGLISMLSGGSGGSSLLSQILGGRQSHVENAIGKSSGLDASKVAPLLAMLAPMVMGMIGKQQRDHSMSPTDLSGMLERENKSIEKSGGGSFIGRMLDQDGDGDFDLQDVMKVGMGKLFGKR